MGVTSGVHGTLAAFDQVGRDAQARLIKVTAETVARVRAAASAACPVGDEPGPFPGHVRDQIKTQMVAGEPQGAVFVERTISGNAGTDNRGVWIERGTVKMGARPFLRPAAEAERTRYLHELEQALELATRSPR
jgi:HK97 gp10 family phage protein